MTAAMRALGVGLLVMTTAACGAASERDDTVPALDSGASLNPGNDGGLTVPDDSGLSADVANGGDGALPPACQFVDVLFVIDNSPSMSDPQENLAKAFPGFVDAMFDKLPKNVDLHVGITATSFFTGSCSESTINCKSAQTAAEINAHYIAPTVKSTGENGGQGRLFKYDGKAFFTANTAGDRAPLKAWFSKAATAVGERGCSYEMHSAGAGYAAHPANAATNTGFFRDDGGVLVVIFLADEPDKSPEGVAKYHDMLTAAKTKCGGDKCIVTAGLINPCVQKAPDTMWQFLTSFGTTPIVGDIEKPEEYTKVVGDALAQVVKLTCDKIVIK